MVETSVAKCCKEPERDDVIFAAYPEVLDIRQVSDALALSPNTVRAMIYQGELPATKLGGKWRILRFDVAELFVSRFENHKAGSGVVRVTL
jgi:excisionase family DNA binding protein